MVADVECARQAPTYSYFHANASQVEANHEKFTDAFHVKIKFVKMVSKASGDLKAIETQSRNR